MAHKPSKCSSKCFLESIKVVFFCILPVYMSFTYTFVSNKISSCLLKTKLSHNSLFAYNTNWLLSFFFLKLSAVTFSVSCCPNQETHLYRNFHPPIGMQRKINPHTSQNKIKQFSLLDF